MTYNFDNIPQELKDLVQWVCWKYETPFGSKPTKVPYDPRGIVPHRASTMKRDDWCSFEEARAAYENSNGLYDGIGFVFSEADEFCGIDFDDPQGDPEMWERQQIIFKAVPSYAELSPSGKGLHIICKAKVPFGKKRADVEIYSSGRYFTMTGNVERNAPIVDCQDAVSQIWEQLGVSATIANFNGDPFPKHEDQAIYDMAANAKNGELFVRLWNGDWTGYPSNADGSGSSEADFALIDIIAHYSNNKPQIQRMFETSALGKRAKYAQASASRRATLIGYMVNKSFDRKLPPVDLSAIMNSFNEARAASPSAVAPSAVMPNPHGTAPAPGAIVADTVAPDHFPPASTPGPFYDGFDLSIWQRQVPSPDTLIGGIAKFIYDASPRPIYEVSLCAALGFMAGMCGRAYNVTGQGLNLYIMLLASSGTGKETMASGISKIVETVAGLRPELDKGVDDIFRRIIGPSDLASGQGLLRALGDSPTHCFVSITGEIGLKMQQICSDRASAADTQLQRVILDLFNKSGKSGVIQPTAYSDKTKNTPIIKQPAYTMLGEGVPQTFYQALDERAVSSGLIPRFICVEYNGPTPYFNKHGSSVVPPPALIHKIDTWYTAVVSRMHKNDIYDVRCSHEAEVMSERLDKYQIDKMNAADDDVLKSVWNRLHAKVMRVAALLAISENTDAPLISPHNIEWATSLVMTDIVRMIGKLNRGELGVTRHLTEQDQRIQSAIRYYFSKEWHQFAKGDRIRPDLHEAKIIPYHFIQHHASGKACFANDKRGAKVAFNAAILDLIDRNIIEEVKNVQQRADLKLGSGRFFTVVNYDWIFDTTI